MNLKVLGIVITALSLTSCSSNKEPSPTMTNGRECIPNSEMSGIVGGSRVTDEDPLSKRVLMTLSKDPVEGTLICTATAIARDVLLTAAHCVPKSSGARYKVALATDITCEAGFKFSEQSITIVKSVVHPQYYSKQKKIKDIKDVHYDLALLKLERPLPPEYEVTSLYDGKNSFADAVLFAGYGTTSSASQNSSGILRQTIKSYSQSGTVLDDKYIFAQQDSRGICAGDSGGPMLIYSNNEIKIAGVNSVVYGAKDGDEVSCNFLSAMMAVPHYYNWIQKERKKLQ